MIKSIKYLIVIAILTFSFISSAQAQPVWVGDFRITGDNETLITLLAGYTEVTGNLEIVGTSLTGLSGLESLTSTGGHLFIENNAALTSLVGLQNLTSVGLDLRIRNNATLTSLGALSTLTSVGMIFYVSNNAVLTNLIGLESLNRVDGNLVIYSNGSLTSLEGLSGLTSVGNILGIGYNPVLQNLTGLENLSSVGHALEIAANDVLTSLSGLENLINLGEHLAIYDNPALCREYAYALEADLRSNGFTGTTNIHDNLVCDPTLIDLASFTATPYDGKVVLKWSTASELDNAGFNLYRASRTRFGRYEQINDSLIAASGSAMEGTTYTYTDEDVENLRLYWYKLEDVDTAGETNMSKPVRARPMKLQRIRP